MLVANLLRESMPGTLRTSRIQTANTTAQWQPQHKNTERAATTALSCFRGLSPESDNCHLSWIGQNPLGDGLQQGEGTSVTVKNARPSAGVPVMCRRGEWRDRRLEIRRPWIQFARAHVRQLCGSRERSETLKSHTVRSSWTPPRKRGGRVAQRQRTPTLVCQTQ